MPRTLAVCALILVLVAGCTSGEGSDTRLEQLTQERDDSLAAAEAAHQQARGAELAADVLAREAAAITDPSQRAAADERARDAAAEAAAARAAESAAYEAAGAVQARLREAQRD